MSSGIYANVSRDPAPPPAPVARKLAAWGTATVVGGVLLCFGGPMVALSLLEELSYALWRLEVPGWVAGLAVTVAAVLAVLAGIAMITLGRGVRALAWFAHRALEQQAVAAGDTGLSRTPRR